MARPDSESRMNTTHSNVDPAEVAKFDALASRWWDPEGEFRPLHQINPLRLDWIRQQVDLRDLKVLDIGCGGGILTEAMASAGAEVTGIDMAEGPLAIARLHQHESQVTVEYRQATAEETAGAEAETYDVVTCLEMLEHVPDPAQVIQSCYELVKPGGHVFFSTINRNPKSFLFAIVGAEYVLKLLPAATHELRKVLFARRNWNRLGPSLHGLEHHGQYLSGTTNTGLCHARFSPGRKIVDVNYIMATFQRKAD